MKPIQTWIAWSVTAVLAGCSSPIDELALRAKSELSMEKSDAQGMSIEEVIAKSKEDGAAPDAVHWIRAKVGSGKGDTFDAKSSEFLVSEIPKHRSGRTSAHRLASLAAVSLGLVRRIEREHPIEPKIL